jgi:ACS family glucarate transporter-like MFS transporter
MSGLPQTSIDDRRQSPTFARYLVVLVTFLAAWLLYLHRFCISYAQRYIKEDLGLTNEQLGYCFSAFFFAYALAQVPSGWLSDRFGQRRMLTLYILTWSLFTGMMGWTMGFVMLLVVRMAVGLGQAGAYPTSAALIARWIPISGRGGANSIVAFGGRLGAGVAPILTVSLVLSFVSMEVPSRLTADDVLDVHTLCSQLVETGPPPPSVEESWSQGEKAAELARRNVRRRVADMMSPETRQLVSRVAEQGPQPPGPGATESIEQIVAALNRIIDRDDLYVQADFAEIPLEKEALRLASQGQPLTGAQRRRLNRLLLEAVFPDALKKLYVQGWRNTMFVYGALGLVVAALFWLVMRDRPAEHPLCNDAEVALIESGRPPSTAGKSEKVGAVPIGPILKSRSLWLMCVNQWGGNVGWVFLVTWLPRYLLEVHSVPFAERGWMAAIPLWAGWAGMLTGGWLTDRVTSRFGLRMRTLPITWGRWMAMSAYLVCLRHPSAWLVTLAFCVVAFSNDLCNPASWAYKQDVGGRYVGSIHGWANMWGNLGATVSPILLQFVIAGYGWDAAFLVCAAAFFIAGAAALGVDARIPIVPPDREPVGDKRQLTR